MKYTKLTPFILAPIALSVMVGTAAAKDVETGVFLQANVGQAKGYETSAGLRAEAMPFGDVGIVNPLSQKRRAWKLSTGYRFDNNFALAFSYADLGVMELGTSTRSTGINSLEALSGGATALSVIYNIPFSESVNMHAKVGYSHLLARANRTEFGHGVSSGSNNDIVYGAGFSFDLTENTSLMLDWERYKFNRKTDLITAGLRYTFGDVAVAKAAPAPVVTAPPVVKPEPIVEPMPAPKPAPIVEMKPLNVNLYFDNDSSALTGEAKAILDQAKSQLSNDRVDVVSVQGSASAIGDAQYNQLLSMRRADAVAQYIKSNWNVDASKVSVDASGEDDASKPNNPLDRKVQVKVKFN